MGACTDLCKKYTITKSQADISRAWDYYLHVFRQIQQQLPKQTSFELQYASPQLAAAEDLVLAVPGSYRAGKDVITIKSIDKAISIINSKQRPRKVNMTGSDGKRYRYLLKGHEVRVRARARRWCAQSCSAWRAGFAAGRACDAALWPREHAARAGQRHVAQPAEH